MNPVTPSMTLWLVLLPLLALILGVALGALFVAVRKNAALALSSGEGERVRAQLASVQLERKRVDEELAKLRGRIEIEQAARVVAETEREAARKSIEAQNLFVTEVQTQLEGAYAKLSQDALKGAIEQLSQTVKPHLDGARGEIVSSLDARKVEMESLLAPLREMLDRYQGEVQKSEKNRSEAYGGLQEQIRALLEAQERTQRETNKLANALRVPNVRGSWGENSLRNCAELSGMSEFCDFDIQMTFEGEDGRRLRPDMIVRLPNKRVIAVDSKAPIDAYLEAANESDENRRKLLIEQHAKNLRKHVDQLSRKEYQSSIGDTLDFTVLFLAGEQFLSSALITDPSIFEFAVERKVFLATPTVLLPLLRAVGAGWKAERQEESARQALTVGLELYDRFVKVFEHIEGIGGALDQAVRKYNEAIRSVETRVLPKARQLGALVDSSKEEPELAQIDRQPIEAPSLFDVQIPLVPVSREERVVETAMQPATANVGVRRARVRVNGLFDDDLTSDE
jgi:DNA recombination protein RmuC